MLNGSGLRVVLWCSGCEHHCNECHNSKTWDVESGIPFDEDAKKEIFTELSKDYISGITFSGGDPLHTSNLSVVLDLINEIKNKFPNKNIWLYTGYTWEEIFPEITTNESNLQRGVRQQIVRKCDVLVDGRYMKELKDANLHWRGSTNQRVIDIKKTLQKNEKVVVLYEI